MTHYNIGAILLVVAAVLLGACSQPRAHAHVRLTPKGVKVAPSLSTSLGGIGVTVSQ
jgi:hypothetical protein